MDDSIYRKGAIVFGAGSVGSAVAEILARNGVGVFHLVDPDILEYPNIGRTTYLVSDIRKLKVDALRKRLLNINPWVKIFSHTEDIMENPQYFVKLMKGDQIDIVIGSTDVVAVCFFFDFLLILFLFSFLFIYLFIYYKFVFQKNAAKLIVKKILLGSEPNFSNFVSFTKNWGLHWALSGWSWRRGDNHLSST